MFSSVNAYRLGSMPGRIYRERQRAGWPNEDRVTTVLGLVNEWAKLLKAAGDCTLIADVGSFKEQIETEHRTHAAGKWRRRQEKHARLLEQLGEEASPELPPENTPRPSSSSQTDSLNLAKALMTKSGPDSLLGQVPETCREAFRLGEAIGRCLVGWTVDNTTATTIWEILTRWGKQEWITDKPVGTPLDPGESISSLVLERAEELDEHLGASFPEEVTAPKPANEAPLTDDPYLSVEQVARLLKVGTDTVERLINSRQLAVVEISGKGKNAGRKFKRIRRESLDAFMKTSEIPPEGPAPARRRRKPTVEKDYFPDV